MPQRELGKRKKWNESNFALQIQDMRQKPLTEIEVVNNRVLTIPPRTRTLKLGNGTSKITLCLHGKVLAIQCPTCEYEAPRIMKDLHGGTAFI